MISLNAAITGVVAAAAILPSAAFASVNITSATFNGSSYAEVAPGQPVTVQVSYTSTGSNDVESFESNATGDGIAAECHNTSNSSTSGSFSKTFIHTAPNDEGWFDVILKAFGTDASILFGLIQLENNDCDGAARDTDTFENAIHVVIPITPEEACINSGGEWTGSDCHYPTPEELCHRDGSMAWNTSNNECYKAVSGGGYGISIGVYCDEPQAYWLKENGGTCWDASTRPENKPTFGARPFPVFSYWYDEDTKTMKSAVLN
jgi:hypothetical protein